MAKKSKHLSSDSSSRSPKYENVAFSHINDQQEVQGLKYSIRYTRKYEHSFAKCLKRGCNKSKLSEVLLILANGNKLPEQYRPHILRGGRYKGKGYWECHICHDWLLIWKQDNQNCVISIIDIGTHAQLFGEK